MISGPPPWAQSGYGVQADLTAEALIDLGHEVAISAYAGVHEERIRNGVQILSTGGKGYGSGTIAGNYRRWDAGLLLVISDCFMIDPRELAGLHVMPWVPVDTHRIGQMDKMWLETLAGVAGSVRPVAMSEHGRRCLADAGWDPPLVPHAVHPQIYLDSDAGLAWRRSVGIYDESFVIAKVGVNNEDDRKAFEVTLLAFAAHAEKYPRSRLYLHTEAQARKAPNLAVMALDLGLKGKVIFADEHKRGADLYDTSWMRGVFSGASVVDVTSKGEGFGVPAIEALACGTPVIGCRNSAMTEKIAPEYGWLIGGQRTWARHHNAWWTQPSERELAAAYMKARDTARLKSQAAVRAGRRYTTGALRIGWAAALASPARPADHAAIFRGAYASGKWGHGSGPGSDPEKCRPYIEFVQRQVMPGRQVLDLGCGDGQLARAIGLENAQLYTGLDVVTGHDIRTCDLPPAQLVLIKDVFQHWPNADIAAMLPRLAGYPRVLITNTISEQITGRPVNADIAAGQWRALDLAAPPFSWPVREVLRWELPGETKSVVELTAAASAPDPV